MESTSLKVASRWSSNSKVPTTHKSVYNIPLRTVSQQLIQTTLKQNTFIKYTYSRKQYQVPVPRLLSVWGRIPIKLVFLLLAWNSGDIKYLTWRGGEIDGGICLDFFCFFEDAADSRRFGVERHF